MKKNKIQFKYDKESEVLSVRLGIKKRVDSDMQDNMVVDYDVDVNGNIVQIDFHDFSFSDFKENKRPLQSPHFSSLSLA